MNKTMLKRSNKSTNAMPKHTALLFQMLTLDKTLLTVILERLDIINKTPTNTNIVVLSLGKCVM